MKEKIICAAIKIVDTGKVFNGHRHNHCIEAMNGELSWTLNRQQISSLAKVQGFVTSEGRFVDRKEGWKIAFDAGQIIYQKAMDSYVEGQPLFSEDLY